MRKSTTDEQSPAFQFYANDWISDPNRLKINLEEQGAYILLYCHCWRGFRIEYDLEILSKMCNCRLDKIKLIFPKIEHLFDKEKDKYDSDHSPWLKFSLTFSTILILLYFIFPSQLIEVVSRINII